MIGTLCPVTSVAQLTGPITVRLLDIRDFCAGQS